MKFLKAVEIAALATFLSSCAPKSSQYYVESPLQSAVENSLLELEEELMISFTEVPAVFIIPPEEDTSEATYHPNSNDIDISGESMSSVLQKEYLSVMLSHELGHAYADQRAEALGKDNWPDLGRYIESVSLVNGLIDRFNEEKSPEKKQFLIDSLNQIVYQHEFSLESFYFLKTISEGIGFYFEVQGKSSQLSSMLSFTDEEYPQDLSALLFQKTQVEADFFPYRAGYHFIKPLMDEFGVQSVIDYVVAHQPRVTGRLAEDFLEYQREIKTALRGEKFHD
ncbi:hypothetical protein HYX13_03385 [Candidatus Woesearchaeota archaeon]|nr:hypothetical protein [Candidatus Woesearchaeota archaeon]